MEEIKIYQQIDWNGFHIGTNADLVPGAIDIEAPIYDSLTHKAKLIDNVWVIKPILEWDLKEGQILQIDNTSFSTLDPMTGEEIVTPSVEYTVINVERPSKYHTWLNNTWVLNEIGLNLYKEEKLTYVALSRDALLEDGVLWEGKLIKGREKDVSGVISVVIKLQMGLPSTWCYSSGEREDITTIERAKALATAVNSLREGAYVKCSTLEEAIKLANTIEELDLIVW